MAKTKLINQTRKGYSYQDKYSLLQVLIALREGALKDFIIDMPFKGRKSVDAEIHKINPVKITAYEVKTGEVFKRGRWKEVRDAIQTLYEYFFSLDEKTQKNVEIIIAISPSLRERVVHFWSVLKFINEKSKTERREEKTMEQVADEYRVKLGFNQGELNITTDKFIEFIKRLDFVSEYPDEMIGENDSLTPLMDAIVSEIDNIAEKAETIDGCQIITSESIALELLEIVRASSEGTADCKDKLIHKLNLCLARRKFVGKSSHEEGKSIDELVANYLEEISKKIAALVGEVEVEGDTQITSTEQEVLE